MNPLLFLVFAANLALAADDAKPTNAPSTETAPKATKRAAATGVAQRQALVPDQVEGVSAEELAKIKAAALKAFQDDSVKAARERLQEVRGRLEFASGAERKDIAADARRAVDEVRSALVTAICKNDSTIKMDSLEKVMDAMDDKRAKAMENAKKKKAADKGSATEDAAKKKAT